MNKKNPSAAPAYYQATRADLNVMGLRPSGNGPARRTHASTTRPAHHKRVARIDKLATAMDSQFRIPATNIKFGLDALAGLVPGIGDAVSSAASAFIVFDAWRLGLPGRKLAAMAGNIAVDFVIGAVPLLGDILDVGWKANLRNARMVKEHFGELPTGDRRSQDRPAPDRF